MKIPARISNTISGHAAEVETDGRKQSIAIAPKNTGRGSSLNGGELLFAALATCFAMIFTAKLESAASRCRVSMWK
jgi:organic hydroperoxide reductase OsmC/OhrA